MTAQDFETVVDEQAGSWRHVVEPQLRRLAGRMRPGEQLRVLAIALRLRLRHGLCLVAATDQRVMLLWTWRRYEEYDYGALTIVSHDLAIAEITLVVPDVVRTLRIHPAERAADIVAAIAGGAGDNRVHARAGAAQARIAQKAIVGTAVCVCWVIGAFALGAAVHRHHRSACRPCHGRQRRQGHVPGSRGTRRRVRIRWGRVRRARAEGHEAMPEVIERHCERVPPYVRNPEVGRGCST